jgi:hypothetical protein
MSNYRNCINCGANSDTNRKVYIGHGETAIMKPYRIDTHGYCQYCKRYKPKFPPIVYPIENKKAKKLARKTT